MLSIIHVHLLLNHLANALVTIPTYMTGEGAEERAEHMPGVPHVLVEARQDAALIACAVVILLGGLALWALRRYEPPIELMIVLVRGVIVGAVMPAALMACAGFRDGLIRHPEVRPTSMRAVGFSTIQLGAST